jgi:hypothetical protein
MYFKAFLHRLCQTPHLTPTFRVVSQKMVVGMDQASGYLVLDEGRMGAGHLRIDIHVVEEYTNI